MDEGGGGLRDERSQPAGVREGADAVAQQPAVLVYRLRKESRPLVTEPTERSVNKAERRPARKRLTLKPVRVVASAAEPRTEGAELLELALPSGTRLRFPAGTDLGYLRALTTAL